MAGRRGRSFGNVRRAPWKMGRFRRAIRPCAAMSSFSAALQRRENHLAGAIDGGPDLPAPAGCASFQTSEASKVVMVRTGANGGNEKGKPSLAWRM